MYNDTLDYNFLIDKFGEQTLSDRFKYLYSKMEEYLTKSGNYNDTKIDKNILKQIIVDYFTDLYRLKEFHKIKNANIVKIVSYTAYWLWRRHPIICTNPDNKKLVFINEAFITAFVIHEMLMPKPEGPYTKEENHILVEYTKQLFYILKYRNIDKQMLEAIFCSFMAGKVQKEFNPDIDNILGDTVSL